MSLTPMQRPFLVGPIAAGTSYAHHQSANHDLGGHGLHLVPAPNRKRKRYDGFRTNSYKFAAVGAALFLVLTI